jgi:hypothetical protein
MPTLQTFVNAGVGDEQAIDEMLHSVAIYHELEFCTEQNKAMVREHLAQEFPNAYANASPTDVPADLLLKDGVEDFDISRFGPFIVMDEGDDLELRKQGGDHSVYDEGDDLLRVHGRFDDAELRALTNFHRQLEENLRAAVSSQL